MSQFLARRTMLGGVRAFTTSVLPVAAGYAMAGASGGAATTLLGILIARKLGYVLASPMALDASTKAMKASAKESDPLKVPSLVPSVTGVPTIKGALPISERYALEAIETLYKQFPNLPDELDNEFNAVQRRAASTEPTAREFYLKQQQSLDDLGTMEAVDQYLSSRYDNKGLIRPSIFGTQPERPATEVDPAVLETPTENEGVTNPPVVTTQADTPGQINQASRMALLGDDDISKALLAKGSV